MGKKFRVGRIISIIISGIILYLSLQPLGDGGRFGRILALVPLSIAAWLFYRGAKKVFDYRETGGTHEEEYDILRESITGETYWDVYKVERNDSEGGFIEHSMKSAMVFTPLCAIDTFIFLVTTLKQVSIG